MGGGGVPVDWLVDMNRFPQEALLDRLAAAGRLDLELMPPLAAAVAALHTSAEVRMDRGGRDGMAWVIDGNASGFAEFGAPGLDPSVCARVTALAHRELEGRAALLDTRRRAGLVRQCHGDLHLRNIVLLEGRPTLFDGVEFNDRISCTDVIYDVAFLLMDLWHRKLPRHANAIWNRYLLETRDFDGVPLLPLFLSCRAAVRAKTSATAARLQTDARRRIDLQGLAGAYLAIAERFLNPAPPCLVAVGGVSGSGKSVLATASPRAWARRQALSSFAATRSGSSYRVFRRSSGSGRRDTPRNLGPRVCHDDRNCRTGHPCGARGNRGCRLRAARGWLAIERVAVDASVPFVGLWLDAPESTLLSRVEQRRGDASDAGPDIVRLQLGEEMEDVRWHRLDASVSQEDVHERAAALVHERMGRRTAVSNA